MESAWSSSDALATSTSLRDESGICVACSLSQPRPDLSIRQERKSIELMMACAQVIVESGADHADVVESLTLGEILSAKLVDLGTRTWIHTVLLASFINEVATSCQWPYCPVVVCSGFALGWLWGHQCCRLNEDEQDVACLQTNRMCERKKSRKCDVKP